VSVSAWAEDGLVRRQVTFSLTENVPLIPGPIKAQDYVPNAGSVVPETIRNCGGKDIDFHVMTDGVAAVVFTVTGPVTETEACIKEALPQVNFESPLFP